MRPFVIGLTGPIGCGKTHVLRTLMALGADGLDADRVAHEVMAPDGPAYGAVLDTFGHDLRTATGTIDRARLGARVFSDPAALARLENILHPAVATAIKTQLAASTAPVFVIEAIKLIEAGLSVLLCDEVWVAVCSEAEQLARLWAGRRMTPAEVRHRATNQMSPETMLRHADRVIRTDGTLAETEALVRAAWVALGFPLPTLESESWHPDQEIE